MSSILSIQKVVKRYAQHTALNGVSLEIPTGSVFGLLGPNGAGKTSLIRIITQITAPDEGKILFNGMPLSTLHINEMGYLPEERGLYKKMEIGEQAVYLAKLKGLNSNEANKQLKYWFEKFEIQSWWNKKVEDLSKGMAQKVQFIITILHQPRFIILDEPFTGFDPINAELIKNELLELKKSGTTIVLSTHRMESVEELCTHIALINKSNVILEGDIHQVKNSNRSHTYEIKYKGNVISFTTALWSGYELISNASMGEINIAKVKLLHGNNTNQLLQTLLPHVEIESFTELIPSMSDIFIKTIEQSSSIK